MDGKFIKSALEAKQLVSIPGGSLLCIFGLTKVTGEYGEFALADYSTTVNGKREMGRVKLPNSILTSCELSPPCFLLYKGMKPTKSGRTCHVASSYAPEGLTLHNMEQKGEELRRVPFAALDALMSAQTLDCFVPGTMFLVKNAVKKAARSGGEEALFVEFETVLGQSEVKGSLMLPTRLESVVRQDDAVILWYGGMQPTKDGKNYHDVKVLDVAMAAAVLKSQDD